MDRAKPRSDPFVGRARPTAPHSGRSLQIHSGEAAARTALRAGDSDGERVAQCLQTGHAGIEPPQLPPFRRANAAGRLSACCWQWWTGRQCIVWAAFGPVLSGLVVRHRLTVERFALLCSWHAPPQHCHRLAASAVPAAVGSPQRFLMQEAEAAGAPQALGQHVLKYQPQEVFPGQCAQRVLAGL